MQEIPDEIKEKRHWWAAALLSVFGLGVGYLYVGRPKRFVLLLAFYVLTFLIILNIGVFQSAPLLLIGFLVLALIINLYAIIEAAKFAWRSKSYQFRSYNKWWVYCFFVFVSLSSTFFFTIAKEFPELKISFPKVSFSIASSSMTPALQVGDYVFVDPKAYHNQTPNRGDIAVFHLPRAPQFFYIIRIVGIPGDTIQMKKGLLLLNGKLVPRKMVAKDKPIFENTTLFIETLPNGKQYQILEFTDDGQFDNTDIFKVPAGHYFFMGDHRDNSADSRTGHVGFVPRANLHGKAILIFWSKNLSRIGKAIE